MEKQTFSGNYEADIASLNLRLRVSESFDLVSRQIMIGSHRAMLWFIDGFIKDGLMEKIMSFMMNADEKKLKLSAQRANLPTRSCPMSRPRS